MGKFYEDEHAKFMENFDEEEARRIFKETLSKKTLDMMLPDDYKSEEFEKQRQEYEEKQKQRLIEINNKFDAEFHKAAVGRRVTLIGGGKSIDKLEGTIVLVHPQLQMFEVEVDTHNNRKVTMDGNMCVFAELFAFGFDVLLFE